MLHLNNTEFEFTSDKKIIKADEYAAFAKAAEIIELANAKAKRIEDEAKELERQVRDACFGSVPARGVRKYIQRGFS